MPIYEYRCESCGEELELFRSIADQSSPCCKSCGGSMKKLISRSSFHLKGTGWYVTDYAGKKPTSQEEKKEASSESSSTPTQKEDPPSKPKSETSSE
jgi:putative FmdB family regulatory protein